MNAWITPEFLVFLAGSAFVMGYLIINQVILRLFMLIGTSLYIGYYATVADTPLWEAIYTSLAMGLANLLGLTGLLARKSKLAIPAEHRDIYPQFDSLPPGDFRTLVKLARRHVTDAETTLAQEGAPVEKLYYILSGTIEAAKLGSRFTLPAGTFVGEVAYMTGQVSAATTVLAPGSEVLEWRVADLRHRSARSSRFKLALEAMISRDLAVKVSFAVAPGNLAEAMLRRQKNV